MKLWRKLAKKEKDESGQERRNGREIKYGNWQSEQMISRIVKTTSLLDALFERSSFMTTILTKAQAAALNKMIEERKQHEAK